MTKSISLDVKSINNIRHSALSVYLQLRLMVDNKLPVNSIRVSIKELMLKSKLGRRAMYLALDELEYEHFIISRIKKAGCFNIFEVSKHYNHFCVI